MQIEKQKNRFDGEGERESIDDMQSDIERYAI